MVNRSIWNLIPLIKDYLRDKPVVKAWLFGSCARRQETPQSDIDLSVDYDNSKGFVSLLTMGGMVMDLSELLGRRVDLVDNEGLKDFARRSTDHDKILIYERGN